MKYHIEFDIDFRRNIGSGLYIALEGIDGSGKTTQVECLATQFRSQNREVVITAEPNETIETGTLIREILSAQKKVSSVALQYLMSANRVINHETIVLPALARGAIVLSSRAFWSAIPYGVMDKLLKSFDSAQEEKNYDYHESNQILIAQGLLSMYHQFTIPDFTFYLDISVDTALSRLSHMKKTQEVYEKRNRLEKIRSGYQLLLKQFPKEFITIDGELQESKITDTIMKIAYAQR